MRKHKHAAEIHLLVGFCVPLEHRKTLKRQFGLIYPSWSLVQGRSQGQDQRAGWQALCVCVQSRTHAHTGPGFSSWLSSGCHCSPRASVFFSVPLLPSPPLAVPEKMQITFLGEGSTVSLLYKCLLSLPARSWAGAAWLSADLWELTGDVPGSHFQTSTIFPGMSSGLRWVPPRALCLPPKHQPSVNFFHFWSLCADKPFPTDSSALLLIFKLSLNQSWIRMGLDALHN